MKETILAAVARQFREAELDVCSLGSDRPKDCDVLIVARNGSASLPALVAGVVGRVARVAAEAACRVIVRHEHRSLVGEGPLLHLIFYPSYAYLAACEPPSFVSYARDRGVYVSGDASRLEAAHAAYRRREVLPVGLRDLQMARYVDVAVMNLVYLATGTHVFTPAVQSELLLYVLRFILTELLVEAQPAGEPIAFWDWDELIPFVAGRYPAQQTLLSLFRDREDGPLPQEQLERGLYVALRLAESDASVLAGADVFTEAAPISPSADR